MNITSLEKFQRYAENNTRAVVYREIMEDSLTPILLLKRFQHKKNLFLLESANLDKTFSRFSFLGIDPEEVLSYRNGNINEELSGKVIKTKDPFKYLEDKLSKEISFQDKNYGNFNGGYVGYLSYEASNECENLRSEIKEDGTPTIILFKIDKFYIFDNLTNKLYAAVSVKIGDDTKSAYKKALKISEEMEEVLHKEPSNISKRTSSSLNMEEEYSKEEFIKKVDQIKDLIIQGEVIQTVISNKYEINGYINPVSFYRAIRRINPSPYLFLIKKGDAVLCGSSPETHLKIENKTATLKPIAGTYRIENNSDIEELKKSLLEDEKERAEHLMLLDLARNDLYTSCKPNTVDVTDFFKAEVYSHLIHIVSTVKGELNDGVSSISLFKKTFPAGTVSGAPKIRAMEIINEIENSSRNFYAGCAGYFGYNRNLDTCITIRTAFLDKDKTILRAGAGIVYDSVSENEYNEIKGKLGALFDSAKMINKMEDIDVSANR